MQILLIDNQSKMNTLWKDVVTLIYPDAIQQTCSSEEWALLPDKEKIELVLIFSENITTPFLDITDFYLTNDIPILCVVDSYNKNEYNHLFQKKVNGLIQTQTTSVKAIKEIVELLVDGGYYLQAPSKQKVK